MCHLVRAVGCLNRCLDLDRCVILSIIFAAMDSSPVIVISTTSWDITLKVILPDLQRHEFGEA